MTNVVIIDGQNFLHRARVGFQIGDYSVAFNFFRNLRAIVEQLKATRVIFVLEGHPKKRYESLPEYKANRKVQGDPDDPKVIKKKKELESFFRQTKLCIDLMKESFPISVVKHADFECDDTIYNLIKRGSSAINYTVVSNDSDFTQLLNEFNNVKIYNPMAKKYVDHPDCCYVTWKALRGDGSDNIPGIPGIGNKTADVLVNDAEKLAKLFEDKEKAAIFERNYELIKFSTWTDEEATEMTSSSPNRDWNNVCAKFTEWEFKSILKEPSWTKFRSTFDSLFSG